LEGLSQRVDLVIDNVCADLPEANAVVVAKFPQT
jgi:hypothetical protein